MDAPWQSGSGKRGLGLTVEAGTKKLECGFETLDFDRVIASARQENTASIHIMQKIGMVSIGDSLNHKGIPRIHYAMDNPGHLDLASSFCLR